MAKKYSASRTTDGIMVFTNGFVHPSLAFNSTGGFNNTNAGKLAQKLRVTEGTELDLRTIKTKFFRENTQIKNSAANINVPVSKNIEYYPHQKYKTGMYGNNGNSYKTQYYENPFAPTPDILFGMNNYRFQYAATLKHILDLTKGEDQGSRVTPVVSYAPVGPSMFNPLYMVSVLGLTNNVPLLNMPKETSGNSLNIEKNLSDCSIRELVRLSHNDNSILGVAKYKYADFMYCKDLGKVSNNHLITLRVFPFPVGDHIQQLTAPKFDSEYNSFSNTGDVGRLVTWFGTDDNKLEDILKYEYKATWRELNAQIEEIQSKEDDQSRGPLGMIINTFSPQYNKSVNGGTGGNHSLWKYIGGSVPNTDASELMTNYDKNKVYEPKDTVQSTYTYEGKLEFTHEFTLNFSYKLRAYDNINPKSAFLDLLGNILAVTYRRGHFWGGDRKFIGPPHNTTAWNKANKIIDQKFDEVGGIFKGLMDNGLNFQSLLGCISGLAGQAQQLIQGIIDKVKGAGGVGGAVNKLMEELQGKFDFASALKGSAKNVLGRPALYAMQSLLTGDDVGLWHVTIGNPKNPIASIGNLILDHASITHSGPLGIDDFPTEIKVSVTLKHGRGRDAVEVSKMYTGGVRALYALPKEEYISKYYGASSGSMNKEEEAKYMNSVDASGVVFDENGNASFDKNKQTQTMMMAAAYGDYGAMSNMANQSNTNVYDTVEPEYEMFDHANVVDDAANILIADSGAIKAEHFGQLNDTMIHRVLNEIR